MKEIFRFCKLVQGKLFSIFFALCFLIEFDVIAQNPEAFDNINETQWVNIFNQSNNLLSIEGIWFVEQSRSELVFSSNDHTPNLGIGPRGVKSENKTVYKKMGTRIYRFIEDSETKLFKLSENAEYEYIEETSIKSVYLSIIKMHDEEEYRIKEDIGKIFVYNNSMEYSTLKDVYPKYHREGYFDVGFISAYKFECIKVFPRL